MDIRSHPLPSRPPGPHDAAAKQVGSEQVLSACALEANGLPHEFAGEGPRTSWSLACRLMNSYPGRGGGSVGQQGLLPEYDSIVGAWVLEKSRSVHL